MCVADMASLFPVDDTPLSESQYAVLREFVRQYRRGKFLVQLDESAMKQCGRTVKSLIRKGLLSYSPCCHNRCSDYYGLSIAVVIALERGEML